MAEVQRDTTGNHQDTLRFLELVSLFGNQAMVALGKLVHPATGKSEKNLDAAKMFIDWLELLERKTRGNLTSDESRILTTTLTDLRLMFVEESRTAAPPPPPEAPSQG